MSKLDLEIVTPDKLFFKGQVDSVIARGVSGDLAILKDRAAIATPLRTSRVKIGIGGEEKLAATVEGYLTAIDNKVVIVTEAAEWLEEIDEERARQAKKRAEERVEEAKNNEKIDLIRAEAALKRAKNRLNMINKD